jgi:hypothetical protein
MCQFCLRWPVNEKTKAERTMASGSRRRRHGAGPSKPSGAGAPPASPHRASVLRDDSRADT